MNVAYFDCFSGAGGDMIVASLIDAGADFDALHKRLGALPVGGFTLSTERTVRRGLAATRFNVNLSSSEPQPHRHLSDVHKIIEESALPEGVKEKAKQVFRRLAEAEARVHGTEIEKVHFHEVGAVDAICDIVGAVFALQLLGVEKVVCSPVPTGSGTVQCEHGLIPIPAPATAELLKGIPLADSEAKGELVTPTAAALLTTLADSFGPVPPMTVQSIGYGAGTRDDGPLPNVLRVMIGQGTAAGETDRVVVLETNLDDVTPEVVGYCMERLFNEGALDVYGVPIQMKKSRNGTLLTVLCEPANVDRMERVLFAETTTFGIRRSTMDRVKLTRRHESVETPFGGIRIKVGQCGDVTTASPEYEDCRAAAQTHQVALRDVIAAANLAWATR